MNSKQLAAIGGLILLAFIVGGSASRTGAVHAAAAAPSPSRWEYAQAFSNHEICVLEIATPTKRFNGESWAEVLSGYSGRKVQGRAYNLDVVNALGADGWELVAYRSDERRVVVQASGKVARSSRLTRERSSMRLIGFCIAGRAGCVAM